jgi:chromosome partitioning protein
MTKIISIVSTKGGVGKTSLCKFVSQIGAKEGRVLVLDLCQNSDIATRFGYDRDDFDFYIHEWFRGDCAFDEVVCHDVETGIDFIPSNKYVDKIEEHVKKETLIGGEKALKEKLDEIKDSYDYIFIDTHPSETNLMIVLPLISSDLVLIPTMLDYSSVLAMKRTIELVQSLTKAGYDIPFQVVAMAVDHKMKREMDSFQDYMKELGLPKAPVVVRSVLVPRLSFEVEDLFENQKPYAKNVMAGFNKVFEIVKGGIHHAE